MVHDIRAAAFSILKKILGILKHNLALGADRTPLSSQSWVRDTDLTLIGVRCLKREQNLLTEFFQFFLRVGGDIYPFRQGGVAELGGLCSDNLAESDVVLEEFREQWDGTPDLQAQAVAGNGVFRLLLVLDEGCNKSAAEAHRELQDRVFPQRGAESILAGKKEIRGHTRIVVQVGEDLVVDHIRRQLVKQMRDGLRRKVLRGHLASFRGKNTRAP